MPRQTRFDRELRTAVPPRSAAQLLASGVTRHALARPGWVQTSRGRYVPASAAGGSTTQRVLEVAAMLPPSGAVTGWAALFAHGVDELDGVDPTTGQLLPVPVQWGRHQGYPGGSGAEVALDRLTDDEVVVRHGLRLTVPVRAAADGLRRSSDLVEAVVLADAAAHAGVIDLRSLAAYCASLVGRRGVRQARAACARASPASRSPWESRLRMFYLDVAGLPAPLVNVPIFERRTGRLVAIADLFDEAAGTVAEFDGQHHRRRRQHREDNVREEALEALNLIVSRTDSLDLRHHPAELAGRLRSAHRRGLARDRSRDLWTLREPDWYRRHEADPAYELTNAEKAEIFGRFPRDP